MTKVPFILDTDVAQDDCVTILLGLLDPRADMRAITTVAGNVDFNRQLINTQLTLNVTGKLGKVPVHLGCTQPMLRAWSSAESVHGDGAGGMNMDMTQTSVADEHAIDALIRITAQSPQAISIVAIGPLTNIATAIVKDRSFVRNVKSLYIMGGSNNGRGNITSSAEFNFYVDPEAAQIVFEAGFTDIHILPWDPVTLRDATFGRDEYDALTVLETPVASFFKKVCDSTLAFNESVGVSGSTHPDSMTLATLLYPEFILNKARYRVDVEKNSELTRGYAAMAWGRYDLKPNATVIELADRAAFYRKLADLLSTITEPTLPIRGLLS